MKPYLGFGTGENGPDKFTVRVFFIQAEDLEEALEILKEMAWEYWDAPVVESLTLLPPGDIPDDWVKLFTEQVANGLTDYTVRPGVLAEMAA